MPKGRKLDRLLRVRTLQLEMVRSQEVAARQKVEQEEALRTRIATLADNVAPTVSAEAGFATGLAAAAHFRERLHQSAQAAEQRVANAERGLNSARSRTQEARRDQSAIEKLIVKQDAADALKALRELENLPAVSRNRHDIC